MNLIVIFDLITFCTSLAALIILLIGWKRALSRDVKLLTAGLFVFILLYSFCLIMEWSGITKALDPFEDLIGALIPMWWAFIFYSFLQQIYSLDLRESEEKYRNLVERANDGVVIVQNGKVQFSNTRLTEMFGYTIEEMINTPFLDYVFPDERSIIADIHKRRLQGEDVPDIYEIAAFHKDGRKIDIETNSGIITYHGKPATLSFIRDITGRKRMEEELFKSKKLESIGFLAGGIAHDFDNLLSIIMGNIELAKDDIKSEAGIYKFLIDAEKASFQAQELTKQLITFSKGGAPVKKIGPIGNLIKETTNFSILSFEVECEFSIPHDLWLVEFDEGQMKHALNNLIVNAAEAMPSGGTIDVKAENFNILSERVLPLPEGKYVKVSIQDHGVGISDEHLPMIFNPYFSTKEMGTQKGIGLGLATTYSIINRHDGHITVESEAGVGTTFTIYLPAAVEEIVGIEPVKMVEPEKPAVRTGRILVMDDEEMIRNLSRQVLSRLGYEPELVKDGAEAIELYRKAMETGETFDAVILDLTIKGGMGGKDTVKALLELDPQVKAIVSSGYSNDPVMTNHRGYGFIGALPKPYTMKDLSDALNKVATWESQ